MRLPWPYKSEYPELAEIDGLSFIKADLTLPREGVVRQYREAVPQNSYHLMVYSDGTYELDHEDKYNPDFGSTYAQLHLEYDVAPYLQRKLLGEAEKKMEAYYPLERTIFDNSIIKSGPDGAKIELRKFSSVYAPIGGNAEVGFIFGRSALKISHGDDDPNLETLLTPIVPKERGDFKVKGGEKIGTIEEPVLEWRIYNKKTKKNIDPMAWALASNGGNGALYPSEPFPTPSIPGIIIVLGGGLLAWTLYKRLK